MSPTSDVKVKGMTNDFLDNNDKTVLIIIEFKNKDIGGNELVSITISRNRISLIGYTVNDQHKSLKIFSDEDASMIYDTLSSGEFGREMLDKWGLTENDFKIDKN